MTLVPQSWILIDPSPPPELGKLRSRESFRSTLGGRWGEMGARTREECRGAGIAYF